MPKYHRRRARHPDNAVLRESFAKAVIQGLEKIGMNATEFCRERCVEIGYRSCLVAEKYVYSAINGTPSGLTVSVGKRKSDLSFGEMEKVRAAKLLRALGYDGESEIVRVMKERVPNFEYSNL